MNLSLAILSFFGAVFLPGAIVYRAVLWRLGRERLGEISLFIMASFVLSLAMNFWLIYALIALGIYVRWLIVAILVAELVAFVWLYRGEIFAPISISSVFYAKNLNAILAVIGVLIALFVLNYALKGGIFTDWDAVVSWNRWASEWASGAFVLNEGGYSQLYPMLLSLGYVASGKISSFQGIGIAIYWYFAFVAVCASGFFFNAKNLSYNANLAIFGVVASAFVVFIFVKRAQEFYVGYVDMPVAMMIFISALCLLKASLLWDFADSRDLADSNNAIKSTQKARYCVVKEGADSSDYAKECDFYLILGALCAGIATQIKQSGLFWAVIFALGILLLVYQRRVKWRVFGLCAGIVVFFVAPWVIIALYKKLCLAQNATNMDYTMSGIYHGDGYYKRFVSALQRYRDYALGFVISLLALRLPNKMWGLLAFGGFVYFVLWATHLSYDLRNLQGGLPLMIIALSGVLAHYYGALKRPSEWLYRHLGAAFMVVIVFGLVAGIFTQERILKGELKRKNALGGKEVNALVLETFEAQGAKTLLTSNQLIAYVPSFPREYYKLYHFGTHTPDSVLAEDLTNLKRERGTFYILIPNDSFNHHKAVLGNAKVLGKAGHYVLLEY